MHYEGVNTKPQANTTGTSQLYSLAFFKKEKKYHNSENILPYSEVAPKIKYNRIYCMFQGCGVINQSIIQTGFCLPIITSFISICILKIIIAFNL